MDEEVKILRSIDDLEFSRRESLRQTRDMIYNFRESEDTDFPSQKALMNFRSPEIFKANRFMGGTTGGVISSGEDDDDEQEDDDDMVDEAKKFLEDIKISADDIVIVASFKLPITVRKEANG